MEQTNTPVGGASSADIRAQLETTPAVETPPITNEAGEGTKESPQPSTADTTPAETTETETKTPESKLYAGKYNSVDELEKGYLESQKLATVKSQEASSNQKILQDLYGEPPKETPLPTTIPEDLSVDEAREYVDTLIKSEVQKETQELRGQVIPLIAELELERMKTKFPDFPELVPHIKQIYEDYPELRKPGNLERAVRLAKAETIPNVIAQAKEEGTKEAIAKMEDGKSSKTEDAKSAASRADKTSLSPDAIAKMSSSEIREFLTH